MALVLTAAHVEQATNMRGLIEAIEKGIQEEAAGQVILPDRINVGTQESFFRLGTVVMRQSGIMGFKTFFGLPKKTGIRYLVAVCEEASGQLLALMDAFYLTAARTGATTGIATKYAAREDSEVAAVIGSGLEGRTNLRAVCAVRPIRHVRVFSTTPERRERFAKEMGEELGVEIIPCDSPEKCVAGADVVIVATNTFGKPDPIAYRGAWMSAGVHVNSIGSTMLQLREIDADTFARADRIVVDNRAGVEKESGDVVQAKSENKYPAENVAELQDLAAGRIKARQTPEEITLFKSVGTAVQDIMAGLAVYQEAVRLGLGHDLGDFPEAKMF